MVSNRSGDLPEKFAEWMGLDRRTIEWHPTIDSDSCGGCGLCVINCGRNVLGYDDEQEVATVENPYRCKVGCTTCGTYCPTGAIEFPDEEYVGELIREHGLLARAREQLEDEFGARSAGD
ncbi:ferredoxin [Halalkaliarchaeum desulfuricum]|uniref:Ferredoxin n=1 Tax=Halalkaliarchaeum desulfuricum TaxID=2055893 RepID=A0A343TG53_9EURY|nr:ferredoxin family protein [Halalkaliarchaeum desulfuricum]AUX08075.1 ferredoxin [Halalkaliarchaeum desulfuricum]